MFFGEQQGAASLLYLIRFEPVMPDQGQACTLQLLYQVWYQSSVTGLRTTGHVRSCRTLAAHPHAGSADQRAVQMRPSAWPRTAAGAWLHPKSSKNVVLKREPSLAFKGAWLLPAH